MVREVRFTMQQILQALFLLPEASVISRCFLSLLIAALLGCGGGTTGTSSTGELKLIGEVRGPNDRSAANRSMIVYSGGELSQEELEVSATDSNGRFEMSLPGSESAVSIAVEGGARLNIRRRFSGSSIVSALLADKADKNELATNSYILENSKLYSLKYAYEIYINPSDICLQLATENNGIVVKEPLADTPCEVLIFAYSEQLPPSRFTAKLFAQCLGNERALLNAAANSEGEMRVDLSEIVREQCEAIGRIEVAPTEIAGVKVSIPFK
jgi:hypothetical protein